MPEIETARPALPMAIEPATPRPSLARSAPMAAFISQLLATRDRLPVAPRRHHGTTERAIGAYGKSAQITVKRMPQGYRKSVTA